MYQRYFSTKSRFLSDLRLITPKPRYSRTKYYVTSRPVVRSMLLHVICTYTTCWFACSLNTINQIRGKRDKNLLSSPFFKFQYNLNKDRNMAKPGRRTGICQNVFISPQFADLNTSDLRSKGESDQNYNDLLRIVPRSSWVLFVYIPLKFRCCNSHWRAMFCFDWNDSSGFPSDRWSSVTYLLHIYKWVLGAKNV